jgi:hypothetical protein
LDGASAEESVLDFVIVVVAGKRLDVGAGAVPWAGKRLDVEAVAVPGAGKRLDGYSAGLPNREVEPVATGAPNRLDLTSGSYFVLSTAAVACTVGGLKIDAVCVG